MVKLVARYLKKFPAYLFFHYLQPGKRQAPAGLFTFYTQQESSITCRVFSTGQRPLGPRVREGGATVLKK